MTNLKAALAQIEKEFGKGTVMKLGDAAALDVEVVSTGCLALDVATGIGGIPRGRIIEVFGPDASGKTTLAYHISAEVQKLGGKVAYLDVEHAVDPSYAQAVGLNPDELLISQPSFGEEALRIAELLIETGEIDLVVVDSVAALLPRAELEGDIGDAHVGLQARLMSQAMRKLNGVVSRSKSIILFINQLRDDIGTWSPKGRAEVTTGGRALKYYASLRMDIRRKEEIKRGDEIIGLHTRVRIVKNKLAAPFKVAEFDILFGKGISRESSVLDVALAQGIVTKKGDWYSWGEMKLGHGQANAREYLEDNPEMTQKIETQVRQKMFSR